MSVRPYVPRDLDDDQRLLIGYAMGHLCESQSERFERNLEPGGEEEVLVYLIRSALSSDDAVANEADATQEELVSLPVMSNQPINLTLLMSSLMETEAAEFGFHIDNDLLSRQSKESSDRMDRLERESDKS